MRIFSASTSATGSLRAGGGVCSSCRSSAQMTGRGCLPLRAARCLPSCPRRGSSAFSDWAVPKLRAPLSTGHAYFHSTGRGGSTPVKSSSSNGNRPSCRNTLVSSRGGCSIRMGGGVSTGCGEGLRVVIDGMSTRATFSAMSRSTFSGCAGRRWISSGWRGGTRGGIRYPWRGGRQWRGSMSLSGLSTDAGASARFGGGVGDQDSGDVVGTAGVDGELHHVARGAQRVGQGPGQGEPG